MAQALLSTQYDVLRIIEKLYPDTEGEDIIRTDEEILNAILEGDGVIRTALRGQYGSSLTCTPYASFPWPSRKNLTLTQKSKPRLTEITVADATNTITEGWEIEFTTASGGFTLVGMISGAQGSGTTATSLTSTNAYVTIPTANWVNTPRLNDKFYFCTYANEQMLVHLSAMMAAAILVQSVYFTERGDAGIVGVGLRKQVNDILKALADPSDPMTLATGEISMRVGPMVLTYNINDRGEDDTDYAEDVDDFELVSVE